ncbi:MAG: dynamin family protein [Bacteroidota bacterium]
MEHHLFDPQLQPIRLKIAESVKELHDMAVDSSQEELGQTLSELRETLNEPFLFVIVGEVKAGKSSFINALLNTRNEIVKVAPDPCTDTIQQVMYGAEEQTVVINEYLKKILLPVDILKSISVVDTPGTNTISDHHQEITERYVPRSDLIVFVFEAKNPYRQSAWEFFDFIHQDWQKKVIFVLQQADLMSTEDLEVNIAGVVKYARNKGINEPEVFALSAKEELEGQKENSGFAELHTYIRENITGLNAYKLKLASSLGTARNLKGKLYEVLVQMEKQVKADREFRMDILHTLRDQEERSHRQIEQLTRQMIDDYHRITRKSKDELSQGLGFFTLTRKSIAAMFKKSQSPQEWLNQFTTDLEEKLSHSFNQRLGDGVEEIADSIRQMAKIVDLKIQNSQSLLKPRQDIFGDISDRRRKVLRELQDGFKEFMARTESFVGEEIFPEASKFSPNIAAGSGMAVIGMVLSGVTSGMALDITGGIISTAGLLFAGGTVMLKRGKILKGFSKEIEKGSDQLTSELDHKLKAYVGHIRQKIDQNFTEFDTLLEEETQHIARLEEKHQQIEENLRSVEDSLAK